MEFPERLAELRKARNLTQQTLADRVGIHVLQIRRYEGGASQPTLDVIRRLAIALSVSADAIVFDEHERGASDDMRLQFEALSALSDEEKHVARAVLDAMIVKSQVAGALERVSKPAKPREKA